MKMGDYAPLFFILTPYPITPCAALLLSPILYFAVGFYSDSCPPFFARLCLICFSARAFCLPQAISVLVH